MCTHVDHNRDLQLFQYHFIFRADQQVEVSGTKYNVFKCIRYERITDYSYKYYIYNGKISIDLRIDLIIHYFNLLTSIH